MNNTGQQAVAATRVWLGGIAYAQLVAGVVTAASVALGLATDGGFIRGKQLAFISGWLLIGYGTIRLWPRAEQELGSSTITTRGTRFERLAWALPPTRWIRQPPPTDRLRIATKLFLAGILTLLISLLMELRFGIA